MEPNGKSLADRHIQWTTEVDALRLLLRNEEFAATYSEHISPSIFRDQLRPIVESALKYWREYRKLITPLALVQELTFKIGTGFTKEKFDAAVELVKSLSIDSTSPQYTEKVIADFIMFQRMENAVTKSVHIISDVEKNGDASKLLEIPTIVSQASEQLHITRPQFFIADLDARTEHRTKIATHEIEFYGYGTGIPELDALRMPAKGLMEGEIGIWMAATGRGKSIALENCARVAAMNGDPVVYFSLELPEVMLLDRIDAMATQTMISQIIEERENVRNMILELQNTKNVGEIAFKELPCTGVTVSQLKNELIKMQQLYKFEPKVICIDYMDLMLPSKHTKEGGWKEQQTVTQELRALGGSCKAAIWTASQGNRNSAAKNDEGDLMSDADVAESYLKLGVADWVITINRTKKQMEMPQPQPAWLNVPKNRTGIANRKVGILTDFSKMSMYEGPYEENPLEAMEEAALQSGAFEGKKKRMK